MKVIEIPFCFAPDPCGGTEVYVECLSKRLQDRGIDIVISCPTHKETPAYTYNGIKIRKFLQSPTLRDISELYDEGDAVAAENFDRIVEEEKPDLVHLHSFTPATSLRLVRKVKKRGIPVIFTYHTPTVTCQRGTLLWGKKVCKGRLNSLLCTNCTLHGYGVPRVLSDILSLSPRPLSQLLKSLKLSGKIFTAIRMRDLIWLRHRACRAFLKEVDHIVAVCSWVKDLLLNNNLPENKITVSLQGYPELLEGTRVDCAPARSEDKLRLVYIGRIDHTKGVDRIIRCVKSLPHLNMAFDIYGIIQDAKGAAFQKKLKTMAACDARITFCDPIIRYNILSVLAQYDYLVVPSQWLETGPLVILEAFAAKVPVIGSNLGGIAERIDHGVNGLLVAHNSDREWRNAILKVYKNKALRERLKKNIPVIRTMKEVTDEMIALYERVAGTRAMRSLIAALITSMPSLLSTMLEITELFEV